MSDDIERAQDGIEQAGHAAAHGGPPHARRAAMAIAALAAMLAIAETAAKDAQTEYLAEHIAASDTWAQYQAKSVRRTVLNQTANVLASLPTATDPAVTARVADARREAERMFSDAATDGMQTLATRAHASEASRDHDMHRYHGLETGSGALQLAIVLVTVSVVTATRVLMWGGVALGLIGAGYALLSGVAVI